MQRTVRRSQTVTPFGVGGLYDFGSESFVAMDITKWKVYGEPEIRLPRLEKVLRVNGFRAAPIAGKARYPGAFRIGKPVPYMRFPRWLFCQSCRILIRWTYDREEKGQPPYCDKCSRKAQLVPMRFIAVCKKGHLMDIPWGNWAHLNPQNEIQKGCREREHLEFISDPSLGAGLQSLFIRCKTCQAKKDLEYLPFKDSLNQVMGGCYGTHPWQSKDLGESCDQIPQVVQRGASNAYYAVSVSAIDIRISAPSSEMELQEYIKSHSAWAALVTTKTHNLGSDIVDLYIKPLIDDEFLISRGVTKELVIETLLKGDTFQNHEDIDTSTNGMSSLISEEWEAFINPPKPEKSAEFIAEVVELQSFGESLASQQKMEWEELTKLISQITLAKRLRIVTALSGFTRLEPEYENLQTPSLGLNTGWLPAVEIFGEGIFISLDEVKLQAWEKRIPSGFYKSMQTARAKTSLGFLPEVTPRFILLHTLAHLMIRQLCFECGYSSSSLAERIYSEDERMAGILIYTASADSEGALGGLVRQGMPDRLFSTIKTAIFRSSWCSNDPICMEMNNQGIQGLNKAACHACTLIAETSCQYANSLLDRAMLIGKPGMQSVGYFESFKNLIEKNSVS